MANEKHDFSPERELSNEHRSDERTTSVFHPALYRIEELSGFCLVRNLSAGGMMASVYTQFAAQQPISVQFHPDYIAAGTIAWSKDERIGIEFRDRIDVRNILRAISDPSIARSPRLEIECEGEVEFEARRFPVRARDISQRGIKLEADTVKPGNEVLVCIEGLEPRKALVRWSESGFAGLNFLRLIPFEQLARWVLAHQRR